MCSPMPDFDFEAFDTDNDTHVVLAEVEQERTRQHARFGEQNHPDFPAHTGPASRHEYYGEKADDWKFFNDRRVRAANLSWDGILLEEVYEALAESDPVALRTELIQVAAVAVAWIEAIDRRESS